MDRLVYLHNKKNSDSLPLISIGRYTTLDCVEQLSLKFFSTHQKAFSSKTN